MQFPRSADDAMRVLCSSLCTRVFFKTEHISCSHEIIFEEKALAVRNDNEKRMHGWRLKQCLVQCSLFIWQICGVSCSSIWFGRIHICYMLSMFGWSIVFTWQEIIWSEPRICFFIIFEWFTDPCFTHFLDIAGSRYNTYPATHILISHRLHLTFGVVSTHANISCVTVAPFIKLVPCFDCTIGAARRMPRHISNPKQTEHSNVPTRVQRALELLRLALSQARIGGHAAARAAIVMIITVGNIFTNMQNTGKKFRRS